MVQTCWLALAMILLAPFTGRMLVYGTQRAKAVKRDLSLYDKAGPFTLDNTVPNEMRKVTEARVREFLWDHWQRRRLGYLVFTDYSKEGEPTTLSFFIEPDGNGEWHTSITWERMRFARGGRKGKWHEHGEYSAYSLGRIQIPKDGLTPRIPISDDEKRPAGGYLLVFKDSGGKTIMEL